MLIQVCLFGFFIKTSKTLSSLHEARKLFRLAPNRNASGTEQSEDEDVEFWQDHGELFAAARFEYGTLHPELYWLENHEELIDPQLRDAVHVLEAASHNGQVVDEAPIRRLLKSTQVEDVSRIRVLTPKACDMLLEELEWHERSKIPQRRPNGMNRYGAILSCDGCSDLGLRKSVTHLATRYLRPLGAMLFPHLVDAGGKDLSHHYGFVVRYSVGEDVQLAEHTDASLLTMNMNLGVQGFKGGEVAFKDSNTGDMKSIDFAELEPGEAILHLGIHRHTALPLTSGVRINMVVWLFGEHDFVRVASHPEEDRMTPTERWKLFKTSHLLSSGHYEL